jgi:hypothetical protein
MAQIVLFLAKYLIEPTKHQYPIQDITYHINVPGLANAITVNTICRVPGLDKLAPGSYTISVKPTIYSPITLSQASTKINIYNNFLEYLLLVIRNLIFG